MSQLKSDDATSDGDLADDLDFAKLITAINDYRRFRVGVYKIYWEHLKYIVVPIRDSVSFSAIIQAQSFSTDSAYPFRIYVMPNLVPADLDDEEGGKQGGEQDVKEDGEADKDEGEEGDVKPPPPPLKYNEMG